MEHLLGDTGLTTRPEMKNEPDAWKPGLDKAPPSKGILEPVAARDAGSWRSNITLQGELLMFACMKQRPFARSVYARKRLSVGLPVPPTGCPEKVVSIHPVT